MKTLLLAGGAVACAAVLVLVMMGSSTDDVCTVESKAKCTSQKQICEGKCQPFGGKDQEELRACRDKCFEVACQCMKEVNCECVLDSKNPGG